MQQVMNDVLSTHVATVTEGDKVTPPSSVNNSTAPNVAGSIDRGKPTSRGNGGSHGFYTEAREQGFKDVYPTPQPRKSNYKKNRKLEQFSGSSCPKIMMENMFTNAFNATIL